MFQAPHICLLGSTRKNHSTCWRHIKDLRTKSKLGGADFYQLNPCQLQLRILGEVHHLKICLESDTPSKDGDDSDNDNDYDDEDNDSDDYLHGVNMDGDDYDNDDNDNDNYDDDDDDGDGDDDD